METTDRLAHTMSSSSFNAEEGALPPLAGGAAYEIGAEVELVLRVGRWCMLARPRWCARRESVSVGGSFAAPRRVVRSRLVLRSDYLPVRCSGPSSVFIFILTPEQICNTFTVNIFPNTDPVHNSTAELPKSSAEQPFIPSSPKLNFITA